MQSASLGLAIAGALGLGYSNIFVTAPSPENLRTLFEFIFKGLDELGFKEHIDYDLVESTNPSFGKAIVRVNVYRTHRQTVQYVQPQHHAKMSQAELLVIDEAAAIPLPMVKDMLGPYLVFLCSTVNGYEGTGRSLSLKLIQQLRTQGANLGARGEKSGTQEAGAGGGRTFREIILQEPIRYSANDSIERWLNDLLCLDAAEHSPPVPSRLPHPDECQLYYVERDTLFSGHKASELFLQRVMSLYVASHYRNTPNDLLLLADAPAHHLFVLLGPVSDQGQATMPDILSVVQVALEGAISKKTVMASLAAGQLPQGDLIPWIIGQQFQDSEFPSLSGARVVRIAVHPDVPRAGYGSRALEMLRRYYEGDIANLFLDDELGNGQKKGKMVDTAKSNDKKGNELAKDDDKSNQNGKALLSQEQLKPRTGLPPLLTDLADRPAERLQYLGTSFGLTQSLYNFWRKNKYLPLYVRSTASEVTGEHTVIMLRTLRSDDVADQHWIDPFVDDFRTRFTSLLGGPFREFHPALALSVLDPKMRFTEGEAAQAAKDGTAAERILRANVMPLTPYDMKRLQAYTSNLADYHFIMDLVPSLCRAYFAGAVPATLSYSQAAIMLCLGLQCKSIDEVEKVLDLPSMQVLALFAKAMKRLHSLLKAVKEAAVERSLPKVSVLDGAALMPHETELDEELEEGARSVREAMKAALRPEELQQYAIDGVGEELEAAVGEGVLKTGGLVSVKSTGGGGGGGLEGEKRKNAKRSGAAEKGGGGYKKKRK